MSVTARQPSRSSWLRWSASGVGIGGRSWWSTTGSSDETVAIAEQWQDRLPGLRIVAADEKAGLPYARNVGSRAATGRILAFCDADDVADPGWLAGLLAGTSRADIVGGCG